MTRIDALKLLCTFMDEVPEDPAWESLMERAGVTPDDFLDDDAEIPIYPGSLDVYEALDVTPDELLLIEPHLNPLIHSQFKERWMERHPATPPQFEEEG